VDPAAILNTAVVRGKTAVSYVTCSFTLTNNIYYSGMVHTSNHAHESTIPHKTVVTLLAQLAELSHGGY
jgi:hypothetical protein